MEREGYEQLARRLCAASPGLPYREELVAILRECFSPEDARVAALLPAEGGPLETADVAEIAAATGLAENELAEALDRLAGRGLVYSRKEPGGRTGYALHRVGFGFPQSFFWRGADTEPARKMSRLVLRYFNREVTAEAFGGAGTKPYRYVPVEKSLRPGLQAVYPHHWMDAVLDGATRFAVAHCPCRVEAEILGRACGHPLEVCLKFDEMADYLIERGLGRALTREEARRIVRESAEAGLVHFVDNAVGGVKHNCNCCGCSCWNVGPIRRRKIPRDALMDTYFLRRTDPERCVGCGRCVEICPVAALTPGEPCPQVDEQWCIGCGVCAVPCPRDAVFVELRPDKGAVPGEFAALHARIREEKETRVPPSE
ncbi:MAG: 4Fe-4S binding protein [Deferrisomatales bacterium]